MAKQGFDNGQYLKLQSQHIQERIAQFGGKLYLEFGGKLFDDFHASRVLPGFEPDSKIRMLAQMKDKAEIIIAINASDIEKNKVRGDLGITYDSDVLRLIDAFRSMDLYVGSVVVTQYAGQTAADAFQKRLESLGVKVYRHYPIAGYPHNITPTTSRRSSPTRASGGTTTWRPAAPWWWSPPPAPAAARWPPVSASSTTSTSGGWPPGTPSLRPSPSGTCP